MLHSNKTNFPPDRDAKLKKEALFNCNVVLCTFHEEEDENLFVVGMICGGRCTPHFAKVPSYLAVRRRTPRIPPVRPVTTKSSA